MTTTTLFEDFTFLHNSDPDIVVLAPQILVVVLNEREIVAALRTAIMHTYSMQIVGLVFEVLINLSEVVILLLNLGLKRFYLMLCHVCVGMKFLD